jgi:hypothetical protein
MSKKHFVAFAEAIRLSGADQKTKQSMADLVIYVSAQNNPNFDKQRFLTACGL